MCIIAYKPQNTPFPTKATLKACFENNPDGAGFMFADNGKVYIDKGYISFTSFWKALKNARTQHGENIPYIMHFRISTQAGTRKDCTHPFPLSPKMDDLRALQISSNIGIAHNGVISLTTDYFNKTITYSDTMKFITDYLSLIITNSDYYKDKNKLKLIDRLAKSKLSILDSNGHCELIGTGWTEENGIFYSNTSYKKKTYTYNNFVYDFDDEYDEDGYINYIEEHTSSNGMYNFEQLNCPYTLYGEDCYCFDCVNFSKCYE